MRTDDVNTAGELRGNRWADVADQISQLLFTTEIVNLRYQIWLCEFEFHLWNLVMTPFGTVLAPNPQPAAGSPNALLAEIRQMKQQLQQLLQLLMMGVNLDGSLIVLDRPIQGAVPDQPVPLSDWWLKWEAHQFPTPGEPWDSTTPFTPPPLPLIMPQINWSTTGTSGQQVDVMEISEFTQGASVYYTTNGTDPTTSSTLYRVAVQIAAGTTVKARAFTADGKSSPIATSVAPSPH